MNIHRITYNQKINSCSLYFIGCNFRCLGCYWKEIYGKIDFRRLKLLNLKETLNILSRVNPKRVYILTGDPKPNPEFNSLPQTLFDRFGCEVRLLTNGFILPDLEGLKHVSISIKAYSDTIHMWYTGKPNKIPLRNFRYLYDQGIELSTSSVYIPGYIDIDEIERIAQFISNVDPKISYRVIGYMPVRGLKFRKPNYEEVERVANIARRYLENVTFSRPEGEDYTGVIDLFSNHLRRKK